MGKKIFVSYKYHDTNVAKVTEVSKDNPIVRHYVTWLENKFTSRTDNIYKGEGDGEDLSGKTEDYIWSKIKDKIFDSTVTIVLISPGMKEEKPDKEQWIPWEISYSIRETKRSDRTSHSNAILAVILPDGNNSYEYYDVNNLFDILKKNISIGYIPVVKWSNFKNDCDTYISKAFDAKKEVSYNDVRKNV